MFFCAILNFLNNIYKEKFKILLEQSAIIRIKSSSYFYCFIHLFTYNRNAKKKDVDREILAILKIIKFQVYVNTSDLKLFFCIIHERTYSRKATR